MSIVIKSNELHTIIYKYLLQAGLSHTAYVMFNQAKLQTSLQYFKFDIKSGHLLTLLEKALIFTQIEAHVNFGQYNQCAEPFYLLKLHNCKITEKVKKQKDAMMEELNKNLTECIKRTNAIYNSQLANKMYDEIIYEPRGMNYFQKFHKLKFSQNYIQAQNPQAKTLKIDSQQNGQLAFFNPEDNLIYLTKNEGFQDIIINRIYPCTLNGQIEHLLTFKSTLSHLIMIFRNNTVKIVFREQNDRSVQFGIPLERPILSISPNPNFSYIVSFQTSKEFYVINIKTMKLILQGAGTLKWRGFDEYLLYKDDTLLFKSLLKQQILIKYKNQEIYIDELQISTNKTFFFTRSFHKGNITVYTFEKEEPLYVFDFSQEQETLKNVIWIYRNQVDYLAILTDIALRVWQVQFNAYCLKIDIQKYQVGSILSLVSLQKNSNQTFLLALGSDNLLVSDVGNQKIQRIQAPLNAVSMSNAGLNSACLLTDENIYFLNGEKLSQLFK